MSDSPAYKTTPSSVNKTYLDRAYALQSPGEAKTLYDEWAKSYDADLSALEYVFHGHAARAVFEGLDLDMKEMGRSSEATGEGGVGEGDEEVIKGMSKDKVKVKVLDAGCGTGLVGVALDEAMKGSSSSASSSSSADGNEASNVNFEITGVDISPGMLDVARKTGLYSNLEEVDLTKPLRYDDTVYDVVVCVGTFTRGHVGPAALGEFVRVTKMGGIIVATVLDEVWEAKGFEKEVERLSGQGKDRMVEVEAIQMVGVVRGSEEGGRLITLRRIR